MLTVETGDRPPRRMPRQRLLALAVVLIVIVVASVGVCWYWRSRPVAESSAIHTDERIIARYARAHNGGREVGRPAGCAARIIGEYDHGALRKADLELLCSQLTPRGECAEQRGTAFLLAAVATVNRSGHVVALALDNENDAGEYQWVQRHFAPRWRHVENAGPRYRTLLQARLDASYQCP